MTEETLRDLDRRAEALGIAPAPEPPAPRPTFRKRVYLTAQSKYDWTFEAGMVLIVTAFMSPIVGAAVAETSAFLLGVDGARGLPLVFRAFAVAAGVLPLAAVLSAVAYTAWAVFMESTEGEG